MALVNRTKKEINAKLVFYGPALSGKKTNIEYIYKKLKPECRGKLKTIATQSDKMLFFDFMPAELSEVEGYSYRFHIYTVSGEVTHPAIWKMVLKGVDGIVFVADSHPDRMLANIESMKSLKEHLAAYGKTLHDIPSIIQCNKQEIAGALSVQEMIRMLNTEGLTHIPTKAKKGEGVVSTLNKLIKVVLQKVRETESLPQSEKKQKVVQKRSAKDESAAVPSLKGDSFDELASFTIAQAAETGNVLQGDPVAKLPATPLMDALEPNLEIVGEIEMIGDGKFRLPLAVMYGGKKKTFAITISLSVQELLR